jgi:His-Xaa-Ser system protein HxsD
MDKQADKYDEVVSLDTDIYPLESIQLAACGFLDETFFLLTPVGGGGKLEKINVAIKARDGEISSAGKLAGRFVNELNRQSLRIALNKMNRNIRTQIVGRALASSLSMKNEEQQDSAHAACREESPAMTSGREAICSGDKDCKA